MEKADLKLAVRGRPGLLVLGLGAEVSDAQAFVETLCLPLMVRDGGFLVAVPYAAFDQQVLLEGLAEDAANDVGPNKLLESTLTEEADDGTLVVLPGCKFYVVDLKDEMLLSLREYSLDQDTMDVIVPFSTDSPYALPSLDGVIDKVKIWASTENQGPRAAFYSAREEPDIPPSGGPVPKKAAGRRVSTAALLDRVEALSAQVQILSNQNTVPPAPTAPVAAGHVAEPSTGFILPTPKMPRLTDALSKTPGMDPVAKAAALLSPPPRQRSGVPKNSPVVPKPGLPMFENEPFTSYDIPQDHMLLALSQQSSALTALVAHLTAGGGDPLLDFGSSSTSSSSTSTRGLLRREKLLTDLSSGSSTFFLQFQQQLFRKMNPSMAAPKLEEDIVNNPPSLLEYLERHGGFKSQRTLGIVLWMLGYAVDAGARGSYCCSHRAMCSRSRRMGLGLSTQLGRRPSFTAFSGSASDSGYASKEFWGIGAASVVDSSSGLLKGDGGSQHQEARPVPQEQDSRRLRGGRHQSQEKAEVSQEAEGQSKSRCMIGVAGGSRPPSTHHEEFDDGSPEMEAVPRSLHVKAPPSGPSSFMINHSYWCAMLGVMCLRSKTKFAAYLRLSFQYHLPPGKLPTIFPIPVPSPNPFGMKLIGLSASKKRSLHRRRALHILVLALNFWHSGGSFDDLRWICRPMSPTHRSIHRRLWAYLLSDGQFPAFPLVRAGRKFHQLDARLSELSLAVTYTGMSSTPYSRDYAGMEVPCDNSRYPELEPYRKMDPSRIKISGTGHWDVTDLLPDQLCVPYREPAVLANGLIPPEGSYPRMTETEEELAALAKLWDLRGLLYLHPYDVPGHLPYQQVRIFGAFKDADRDRQIGDKRGRNYGEDKVSGPSACLPSASDLCELRLDPKSEKITLSITDRRDFYHQIRASPSKAITNTLGPGLDPALLEGTEALNTFLLQQSLAKKKKNKDRTIVGDKLGGAENWRVPESTSKVFVAFNSILQGDHAGVEIACAAHQQLLRNSGLLCDDMLLQGTRPWLHPKRLQGLVIDDFFSVAITPKSLLTTPDVLDFDTAQSTYAREKLEGSPDKDVRGASSGKVIGGYINGDRSSSDRGIVSLSSPPEKRYGMSWITMQVCQLPATSDALHLSLLGGWTSMAMFRRCCMGLFNESHHLVDMDFFDQNHPKLVPLPRSTAEELLLAAILVPVFQTNLASGFGDFIFATDASEARGSVCQAPLDCDLQEVLFRTTKSKGSYTRLLRPEEKILRDLGEIEDGVLDDPADLHGPTRTLACRYHFIEVFAGAAVVTSALSSLGCICGPPLELSDSPEFDLKFIHVVEWLTYMLLAGHLQSVMVEPPCTTFSIMRRPPLRCRSLPYGHDPLHGQTKDGNILAHRGFQLLDSADSVGAPGLLETPNSSMLKYLPSWKNLEARRGFKASRVDSCAFGSPHLKSFKFLHVNMVLNHSLRRCRCTSKHLKVEGSYTKASATYVPDLAYALALDFKEAIVLKNEREEACQFDVVGLENQATNHVVNSLKWEVVDDWAFKKESHINLLEMRSLERLVEHVVKSSPGDLRIVSLVDSNVTRCAVAKGRSSSMALASVLRRISTTLVAGGLQLCTPYCPTRLNVADDPTRLAPLRSPAYDLGEWSRSRFIDLAMLPPTRRWASNWIRLVLRATHFSILPSFLDLPHRRQRYLFMDFDQTLGFPGEGPLTLGSFLSISLHATFTVLAITSIIIALTFFIPLTAASFLRSSPSCPLRRSVCLLLCLSVCPGGLAMEDGPRNQADLTRIGVRTTLGPLPEGRIVLEVTAAQRDKLLGSFYSWCDSEGLDIQTWLGDVYSFLEEINLCLCRFGRTTYNWGRPMNHFVETINALTSLRPALRRNLQAPWDLAFNWSKMEPNVHHIAAPFQVIMAMIAVCLMWGWLPLAGAIAMMWGALLRPGELVTALKWQLTLPSDLEETIAFGILSITEPKTRFSAARHQAARLDIPDLLEVVEMAYGGMQNSQRLWPYSGQTMRVRFKDVLRAIGLPTEKRDGLKPLDLGSLRAGGATWLLQATESGELVRRRGRWVSQKVMDLYIQEVSSLQYLNHLSPSIKQHVLTFARAFPGVLEKATTLHSCKVDCKAWHFLFRDPR